MIKIGIIGLGGIAGAHLAAYKRYPEGARIVAAADGKGKDAYSFGMLPEGARLYTDYREMLEKEELDAVDICAPSHLHRAISEYALRSGVHVLCEKPMALSSEDAESMVSAAHETGKVLMCAQIIRFTSAYAYLRETVKSGVLGKPVQFNFTRLSAIPRWRLGSNGQNSAANGGVMFDLSIHDVDYVYSLFGEPEAISGIYAPEREGGPDDFFTATLGYKGFTVTVNGGFFEAEIAFNREFYAVFEKGDLRLCRDGKLLLSGEELDVRDIIYPGEIKGLNIELSSCFVDEIGHFISCVEARKESEIASPESTAGGIKLAKRIIDSLERI
jgi:predicted dehydrogenase